MLITGWDAETVLDQMTATLWKALHRSLRRRAYAAAGKTPPPDVAPNAPEAPAKEYMTAERWQGVINSGAGNIAPR